MCNKIDPIYIKIWINFLLLYNFIIHVFFLFHLLIAYFDKILLTPNNDRDIVIIGFSIVLNFLRPL